MINVQRLILIVLHTTQYKAAACIHCDIQLVHVCGETQVPGENIRCQIITKMLRFVFTI